MHNLKKLIKYVMNRFYYLVLLIRLRHDNGKNLVENVGLLDKVWEKKKVTCHLPKSRKYKVNIDLSLVIPCYNSEMFLDKLVECLVKQKTKYRYEVIFVDDGSTDRTGNILKEYGKKYSSIIRVFSKKNGGISSARNMGLENVRGKYIGFIDHDDLVSESYIERLMDLAYKNNADVVKCGIANLRDGKVVSQQCEPDEKIVGGMKKKILNYSSYAWGKIFKLNLIKDVRFPEGYWYEDMITRFLLYRKVNVFVNISERLYYRSLHSEQMIRKDWGNEKNRHLEHLYLIEQLVKEENNSDDLYLYLNVLFECSSVMVHRVSVFGNNVKRQVFLRVYKLLNSLYKEEYSRLLNGEWKLKSDIILKKRYDLWLMEKYL